MDDLPCALVELDAEGRIVDSNDLFRQWTGLSPEELSGRPYASLRQRIVGIGGRSESLVRLANIDGTSRAVMASSRTVDGRDVVVLVDASERAEHEREMLQSQVLQERTRNRLQLIIDSSISFSAATTEQELVDILVTTVAQAYQAEQAAVFLVDDLEAFTHAGGSNPLQAVEDAAPSSRRRRACEAS
ncbi:PAS domain-containing protein [Leifsonia poae]|uniref:PAS domain-containing protein n=1 Tax=Leifsonia poae TaxID=110933 RepID=UPI003D69E05F